MNKDTHHEYELILASGSITRAVLMKNAGLQFGVKVPNIDEESVKASMLASAAHPRDIADGLADLKAQKIAHNHYDSFVLGCDQVLEHQGQLLSKPASPEEAVDQLQELKGKTHRLLSAAVIYHHALPVWRHIGTVRMGMRSLSDAYVEDYVSRNWDSIRHAVGGYKLEEEGVRLFSFVQGDYFHVLGMPLLEVLSFLSLRGIIRS